MDKYAGIRIIRNIREVLLRLTLALSLIAFLPVRAINESIAEINPVKEGAIPNRSIRITATNAVAIAMGNNKIHLQIIPKDL